MRNFQKFLTIIAFLETGFRDPKVRNECKVDGSITNGINFYSVYCLQSYNIFAMQLCDSIFLVKQSNTIPYHRGFSF